MDRIQVQTGFEARNGLCLLIPDLSLLCSPTGNYQFSFSSATYPIYELCIGLARRQQQTPVFLTKRACHN